MDNRPGGAAPVTYQVTTVSETTQVGPSGLPVRGVLVGFTLGDGHTGTVFLSNADFTPDNVAAAVRQRALMVKSALGVQGTV